MQRRAFDVWLDRGLEFDLQRLQQQAKRRQFLHWLGAASLLPVVGACAKTAQDAPLGVAGAGGERAGGCSRIPRETEGPYPGDATNGPSALALTGIVLLVTGANHNCARLQSGAVKCFGQNGSGQLGLGDTDARGDALNEIGAMMPALMRPAGNVSALAAGSFHSCVVLDESDVLCWGQNTAGQLGRGSMDDFGDDPGETMLALPGVEL